MKKALYLICTLLITGLSLKAQNADGLKMSINGFGDIIYGQTFGNPADANAASLFTKYGDPDYPTGMHNGFTSHGVDLLGTVSYKDNFKFQTEWNIEGSRGADGGEYDLEIERLYVDYSLSDKLGFQFGYMFTPIGYINRNLYSRAWLMNSIRFYQSVEANAGILPNHFLGGTAYGTFVLPKGNSLNYIVGYGKARDMVPEEENYFNDLPGYQLDGNLELHIASTSDIRLAVGGFTNEIHTYNVPAYGQIADIGDSTTQQLVLQETGINPYFNYDGKLFHILVEYAYVNMQVKSGNYPGLKNTDLSTLSAEWAVNFKIKGKKFSPYVRYDYVLVPLDMGPYYGLRRLSDDELTKVYVPDFNAVMIGVAYDLSSYNRIKLEYIHQFNDPYLTNGLFVQTAFGF